MHGAPAPCEPAALAPDAPEAYDVGMRYGRAAGRDAKHAKLSWLLLSTLAGGLGTATTGHAQDTVRVLSYNVRHGAGMDGRVDLARVAGVIRAARPDVVLLQEIDVGTHRTGGVHQAEALARLTGLAHWAFGPFMAYDGGEYGMALLSATPVSEQWNHRLPDGEEPRTALAARIAAPAGATSVTFVGIHLYRTVEERQAQAARLVEIFAADTGVVLLVGDFNSEPGGPVMELLGRHWAFPAKPESGRETWPSDAPRVDIDHVLFRPARRVRLLEYRVIDEREASDHRPVLAVLEIR